MAKELVILGASGHAKVIADIARCAGYTIKAFLDDDTSKQYFLGINVAGKIEIANEIALKHSGISFFIAIGSNKARSEIAQKYSRLNYVKLIHPSAVISASAKIGDGTVVMPNSVVNADASIGTHCILNTSCVIEHDNILEDFVHISPRAALGGNVRIGRRTHIGLGASVKNGIKIAEKTVIGVGAAVVNDINISGTYVGIPAKPIK